MTKIEKRILDFVKRNYIVIFFISLTIVGVLMRFSGRNFKSGDFNTFLSNWYDVIKQNGQLLCLRYQVGNYNVLYQTLIALLTYVPLDPLYAYKVLSIAFDFSLAVASAMCIYEMAEERRLEKAVLVYSLVWTSLIVVFNSTFFAQADSIYTSFIVWGLFFLSKKRNKTAFVCLGIAFAFKAQAVFILPFLCFLYVLNKQFSIMHIFLSVVVGWASSIPAICYGRGWLDFFAIYGAQHAELKNDMAINYPNFWVIVGGSYENLQGIGVLLATTVLGVGMYILLCRQQVMDSYTKAMGLAVWTVWTVVMFVPGMHDRYGYLLEILLLCAVIFEARKYVLYASGIYLTTIIAYANFLFGKSHSLLPWATLYTVLYTLFTVRLFVIEMGRVEEYNG